MSWFFKSAESDIADATPAPEADGKEVPGLDKDEIRRRRLANYGDASSQTSAPSLDKLTSKRERTDAFNESIQSPVKVSAAKIKDELRAGSADQHAAVAVSSVKSPSRAAGRVLTFTLEFVFQFSLRRECEAPIQFIEGDSIDGNFDSSQVSELVCGYIMSSENLSAMQYLLACHKRLFQKQLTAPVSQKQELEICREQIIRFIVSCLSEPDIFGLQSAKSISDFVKSIGSDFHPSSGPALLRCIADELEQQDMLIEVN